MLGFLFGWWVLSNQDETNEKLQHANKLQQQNNALLEQIRRLHLTPAQRAQEDALRAAEAHRRRKQRERVSLLAVVLLVVVFRLLCIQAFEHQEAQAKYPGAIAEVQAAQTAQAPSEAEKAANWQRILEMRNAAAKATPSPSPDYAPRAELVRLPSNP